MNTEYICHEVHAVLRPVLVIALTPLWNWEANKTVICKSLLNFHVVCYFKIATMIYSFCILQFSFASTSTYAIMSCNGSSASFHWYAHFLSLTLKMATNWSALPCLINTWVFTFTYCSNHYIRTRLVQIHAGDATCSTFVML